jgi:hypothetical protein
VLDWTRRERAERAADGEEITGENEIPAGTEGARTDGGQDAA